VELGRMGPGVKKKVKRTAYIRRRGKVYLE